MKIEDRLLKIALIVLEKYGMQNVTMEKLSLYSKIDYDVIIKIFERNSNLQIRTLEYSACLWNNTITHQCNSIIERREKLIYVIEQFVFGTYYYEKTLSAYIVVLNQIVADVLSETEIEKLKSKLCDIYLSYFEVLIDVIGKDIEQEKKKDYAWILVALSDGMHIQKIINNQNINIQGIINMLAEFVKS